MEKTDQANVNSSEILDNEPEPAKKKIADYREDDEHVPIGSIVSTYAHPYDHKNNYALITNYANFTPPLMVVVEKKFGAKYNNVTGDDEDNDTYKCLYYSTSKGGLEENWFKRKEIKFINEGSSEFFTTHKDSLIEKLKRDYFGELAILCTVDLELKKKKIWSDTDGELTKLKINNLLDYLPPLGTIIDFKLNEDYQRYSDKDKKISYRKSKILVKLRWLNNATAKFSEEYFPMVSLKLVKKSELTLRNYNSKSHYNLEHKTPVIINNKIQLIKSPLRFHDVIWKHYYYIYRFKDLFTQQIRVFKPKLLFQIKELISTESTQREKLLEATDMQYRNISSFFSEAKKTDFEKKWFEIQYADKNQRNSKRIIYIDEVLVETLEVDIKRPNIYLKANCLLRGGESRHFNVSRIVGYREIPNDFFENIIFEPK